MITPEKKKKKKQNQQLTPPEKLKRYQRAKFESYKKINNLKINDNEAYISIKVDKYDNIISPYSLDDRPTLKGEFLDEIEQRASIIPLDYPLVLEIHNNNFTAEQKIMVRKLIKNHFTFISINKEFELKRLKRKSLFLIIAGILTFVISMLVYNIDIMFPFFEILNFITWYSVWECGELVIFDQDGLKEQIIKYKHLSKVRVVYDKE